MNAILDTHRLAALLQFSLLVYGAGWLALFVAPLRFRFCWIFARSCAVFLGFLFAAISLEQAFSSSFAQLYVWNIRSADSSSLALFSLSLFVGSWQVEDSPYHSIPHFVLLPCLLLTAATGAIGFAVHIIMRDLFKFRNRHGKDPKT